MLIEFVILSLAILVTGLIVWIIAAKHYNKVVKNLQEENFKLKNQNDFNQNFVNELKLEFGKTSDGEIVLADEISPDTCRFWDSKTHEKLDKDRFRRDLGNVEDAYNEMEKRILG